jgi:hypothetical protein
MNAPSDRHADEVSEAKTSPETGEVRKRVALVDLHTGPAMRKVADAVDLGH